MERVAREVESAYSGYRATGQAISLLNQFIVQTISGIARKHNLLANLIAAIEAARRKARQGPSFAWWPHEV